MKPYFYALAAAVLATPVLADCTVDRAAYDALEFDMTYAQVAEIFGCEADETTTAEITSGQATVHAWIDADTGATVTTVFQGDALASMMAPN